MRPLTIAFLLIFVCIAAFAEELDEIVIFEDSLAVKENSLSSNMEVITNEKIEALSPSSTADLLKTISGVSVKSYDAKHVSIDMGGYGAEKGGLNSVIMLNGRRITSPDMSSIDWNFIPVDSIERVEVYHGGNSVLFGDRATGGAINIVTKKPVKSGFSVKTEAGSYGMYHGNLAGQYASDRSAVLLTLDNYSTDGYRENSELETKSASADATYYHDNFEVNLFGTYTDSGYGLPGGASAAELNANGREYSNTPNDGGDDYEYIIGAGTKVFLPVGVLNIKADYRERERDYTYYTYYYHAVDKLKSRAVNPFYTLNIDHKNYSNRFTAGFDYIRYDVQSKSESAFSNSSFDIDREMKGFYISDRVNIKGFVAEAGFRTENLSDDYKSDGNSKDEDEKAYNILFGYESENYGSVYARYDKSFRFPTTDELREYYGGLNTELDPQTSETFEIGYSYKKGFFYGDALIYQRQTDDEIFTSYEYVTTYTGFSNENIDTKRKGADVKIGYGGDALTAEAAFSYVDADIDEGATKGNDIPLLSKNKLKGTIGYKCPFGVGVYYFVNYYSSAYAGSDYANQQDKIDAYMVSDVKIDYEYDRFSFFFKVNNMFNEKYYDYAFRTEFSESYYPAAERNFAAGLTFRY